MMNSRLQTTLIGYIVVGYARYVNAIGCCDNDNIFTFIDLWIYLIKLHVNMLIKIEINLETQKYVQDQLYCITGTHGT